MLGRNIIIIVPSYFLLRRGVGIIMRIWRLANAEFEEQRPERRGKKSHVSGPKCPGAHRRAYGVICRLRKAP
jgi:hypothetical protein